MKNIRKLFGTIAITAIVVLGLTLTACQEDDTEYSLTFINQSSYKIHVTTDATPSSFELARVTSVGSADRRTATKKGNSNFRAGWTLPDNPGPIENYIVVTRSPGYVTFNDNPNGLKIIPAEQE